MGESFLTKIEKKWSEKKFLCVGLDPVYKKLPKHMSKNSSVAEAFFLFNKAIIDATHDLVCCFKPQIAHYSAEGISGFEALLKTMQYIKTNYPEIPVILDAKRGDIGSTSEEYAREAFDVIGADAVTVNPYFGLDALEPFLKRDDKGIIVLCRTSNPSASDFQDLLIEKEPLYIHVAKKVVSWNDTYKNCLLVVGATYPEELRSVRSIVGDMPILIPGIGAQGGDLDASVKAGKNSQNTGIIISSSRSILYASGGEDFAEKAQAEAAKLSQDIQKSLGIWSN